MSLLVTLVNRLLDIYRREPDAAARALDEPSWAPTDELSDTEATKMVRSSVDRSRRLLNKRTLINVEKRDVKYPVESLYTTLSPEQLKNRLEYMRQPEFDDALTRAKIHISASDFRDPILRVFLSRSDDIAELIALLDDSEDFTRIPSEGVRALLREAHLNFLHGTDAGATILFWAAIECALNEVVPVEDREIEIRYKLDWAEEHSFISNALRVRAESVYDLRIDAVHHYEKFKKALPSEVGDILLHARSVIAAFYGLDQE